MRVSALTNEHDWRFGHSKSNYVDKDEAIKQNIQTRLLSFKNNWFLDINANIDWIGLLGTKNNENRIKSEVNRVTLSTDGVVKITKYEAIADRVTRKLKINLTVSTIFSSSIFVEVFV